LQVPSDSSKLIERHRRCRHYGERQYNAADFHGHRWDFTETIADIAPEEWSGGAYHLE
jgi:hypothetical protein